MSDHLQTHRYHMKCSAEVLGCLDCGGGHDSSAVMTSCLKSGNPSFSVKAFSLSFCDTAVLKWPVESGQALTWRAGEPGISGLQMRALSYPS